MCHYALGTREGVCSPILLIMLSLSLGRSSLIQSRAFSVNQYFPVRGSTSPPTETRTPSAQVSALPARTAERDESGHRLRYHCDPLVHGDEEPGASYQHASMISIAQPRRCSIERLRRKQDRRCPPVSPTLTRRPHILSATSSPHPIRAQNKAAPTRRLTRRWPFCCQVDQPRTGYAARRTSFNATLSFAFRFLTR